MPSSSSKKSSITRKFTGLISQKAARRPSTDDAPKEGSLTPPAQTTTPSILFSSSSSSPQSIQSRLTNSPASTRYTFEQHRLPVTFLPFVTTDTPFLKGLDVFGESRESPKSSFEFNDSPVDAEDNWFNMSDEPSSAFDTIESAPVSRGKAALLSPPKSIRIGWICEDGFKPIGDEE